MNQHRKLRKIAAFILSAVLLTGIVSAAPEGPSQILLSWTGDPATTMTFTWRDDSQGKETVQVVPQAQYDKAGFENAAEFSAACKDVSLDGSGAWRYEATAADLTSGTTYVYRVGTDGMWSEPHTFITADPDEEMLTFAYMGDVQTANDTAADYALWGDLIEAMAARNPELSFAVLGGG